MKYSCARSRWRLSRHLPGATFAVIGALSLIIGAFIASATAALDGRQGEIWHGSADQTVAPSMRKPCYAGPGVVDAREAFRRYEPRDRGSGG